MKKNRLLLLLMLFSSATAQKIQYYDYDWRACGAEKASIMLEYVKDDSGWHYRNYYMANHQMAMETHFISNGGPETGWTASYYPNGQLSERFMIYNRQMEGLDLRYHYNGMLKDSVLYQAGYQKGIGLGWYPNGYLRDSANYPGDGTSVQVNWYDNGQLASAGHWKLTQRTGRWVFYHPNGINAAIEDYDNGRLVHSLYYDEDGLQLADSIPAERPAALPGGNAEWLKLLNENLHFSATALPENKREMGVVISFRVDQEGWVRDAYVEIPFQPLFDEEALRVVKLSPRWIPAASHNQRISSYQRQYIPFRLAQQ